MTFQEDQPPKTKCPKTATSTAVQGRSSCPRSLGHMEHSSTRGAERVHVNFIVLSSKPSGPQVPVCDSSFFFHCPFCSPPSSARKSSDLWMSTMSLIPLRSASWRPCFYWLAMGRSARTLRKGALKCIPAKPPDFKHNPPVYPLWESSGNWDHFSLVKLSNLLLCLWFSGTQNPKCPGDVSVSSFYSACLCSGGMIPPSASV